MAKPTGQKVLKILIKKSYQPLSIAISKDLLTTSWHVQLPSITAMFHFVTEEEKLWVPQEKLKNAVTHWGEGKTQTEFWPRDRSFYCKEVCFSNSSVHHPLPFLYHHMLILNHATLNTFTCFSHKWLLMLLPLALSATHSRISKGSNLE